MQWKRAWEDREWIWNTTQLTYIHWSTQHYMHTHTQSVCEIEQKWSRLISLLAEAPARRGSHSLHHELVMLTRPKPHNGRMYYNRMVRIQSEWDHSQPEVTKYKLLASIDTSTSPYPANTTDWVSVFSSQFEWQTATERLQCIVHSDYNSLNTIVWSFPYKDMLNSENLST